MASNESNQTVSEAELSKQLQGVPLHIVRIYPRSLKRVNGLLYGLVRSGQGKRLVVVGNKDLLLKDPFSGKIYADPLPIKICDLSRGNTLSLMNCFPFTKPVSVLGFPTTLGLGDRLGLATPGHLRAIRKFKVRPVLAQQSIRENHQTGRNFEEVIAEAAWSVFQEDYQEGYGADGDHLKSLQEVKRALEAGVSMITLDLSEKLNLGALTLPREAIEQRFKQEIDPGDAEVLLHLFLDKEFQFKGNHGDLIVHFKEEEVKRHILLFQQAIDFAEEVYQAIQQHTGRRSLIDFEISIDEIPVPTSSKTHLFMAIALRHRGVQMTSLAPRFVGEFQKGIDYRGEVASFKDQFYHHCLISQHYGDYKLSIHSGSDKFSILPHIGKISQGKIHLKTAGTSWLEAVRLINRKAPTLFREMVQLALSAFEDASAYYHVITNLPNFPVLEELMDRELPDLLDQEDARQLFHITYGFLLRSNLRDQIFKTLTQFEDDYASLLDNHFQKHLDYLGIERRDRICR